MTKDECEEYVALCFEAKRSAEMEKVIHEIYEYGERAGYSKAEDAVFEALWG